MKGAKECRWKERVFIAGICPKHVVRVISGKLWLHKRSSSGVGIVIHSHSLVFWMGWEGRSHE